MVRDPSLVMKGTGWTIARLLTGGYVPARYYCFGRCDYRGCQGWCTRLGLQKRLDGVDVSPPGPYILGQVSGGPSSVTGRNFLTLNLSCTAGSHLPYESWTPTSMPLSGPRQVQASSSWA